MCNDDMWYFFSKKSRKKAWLKAFHFSWYNHSRMFSLRLMTKTLKKIRIKKEFMHTGIQMTENPVHYAHAMLKLRRCR